jgi:hypothetical protein
MIKFEKVLETEISFLFNSLKIHDTHVYMLESHPTQLKRKRSGEKSKKKKVGGNREQEKGN